MIPQSCSTACGKDYRSHGYTVVGRSLSCISLWLDERPTSIDFCLRTEESDIPSIRVDGLARQHIVSVEVRGRIWTRDIRITNALLQH